MTPGQLAFNRFNRWLIPTADRKRWADQDRDTQQRWEQVASDVRESLEADVYNLTQANDYLRRENRRLRKENKDLSEWQRVQLENFAEVETH